jgi:UDP-N-acetylglucosamine--N-acetylmuramyl-(pentapeptide) pyrophosphoryl-undecaprenol N-acetylglucosamine transferase
MALVNKNAGILVKDIDARSYLKESLFKLLSNNDLQYDLSLNIKKLAYADAAEKIADVAISLAESS